MLPPELFTASCKVLYVCRNPKDTCVSYFHHTGVWQEEYREDYDHFEEMFLNGTFMHGSYWHHLKVIDSKITNSNVHSNAILL